MDPGSWVAILDNSELLVQERPCLDDDDDVESDKGNTFLASACMQMCIYHIHTKPQKQ